MAQNKMTKGPQFVGYFGPVLEALRELGGSARPYEVREKVAESLKLPTDVLSEEMASGTLRFDNQVAWARFYLAKAGIIDASSRGVWTLTEKGRSLGVLNQNDALKLFRDVRAHFRNADKEDVNGDSESELAPPENLSGSSVANYRQQLLETLRKLPASGFERFCQRLLRESGFQEVTVTGRSNDGGIDGLGILQVSPLVSFKVLFQCKKYIGSVVPAQVRDFRGAMQGRADKGIIVTTGVFTLEAKKEAIRDGVPPIELVDGEKLVTMIEQLELGLVPIKSYRVDEEFFEQFK